MFSVGGQSGELLVYAVLGAILSFLYGYSAGCSSTDLLVYTTGVALAGALVGILVHGRAAGSPDALKPGVRGGEGIPSEEPIFHPPGAAQVKLFKRLAVLDLHPTILQTIKSAIAQGRWYGSVEDLETYFRSDSFDTIVEEVRELGLDVNQAKSFVWRMKREFERADTPKVRRSQRAADPHRPLWLAFPWTSPD